MMFLLPIVLVILFYFLFKDDRVLINNGRHKRPLTILGERLSKGEITIEEYRKLKSELT